MCSDEKRSGRVTHCPPMSPVMSPLTRSTVGPQNRDLATPMGGLCLEGQSHPVRRAVVGGFELSST